MTKAHGAKAQAEAEGVAYHWYGNDLADASAKVAAEAALPSNTYPDSHDGIIQAGITFLLSVSCLLALWPNFLACVKQEHWAPALSAVKKFKPASRPHKWVWSATRNK